MLLGHFQAILEANPGYFGTFACGAQAQLMDLQRSHRELSKTVQPTLQELDVAREESRPCD